MLNLILDGRKDLFDFQIFEEVRSCPVKKELIINHKSAQQYMKYFGNRTRFRQQMHREFIKTLK